MIARQSPWLEQRPKGIGKGRIKRKIRFGTVTKHVHKTKKDQNAALDRYVL